MASKKIIKNNNKEVYLYMLEIFIDKLNLNSTSSIDRFFSEFVDFSIHIKFLNCPELIINSNEFAKQLIDPENSSRIFKFDAGTSCIFLKNQQEFSRDIKDASLTVKLCKQVEDKICSDIKEDIFLCKTDINLSKCLCQKFSNNLEKVKNNHINPISHEQKNIYELLDKNNLVVGNADISIRLTCFGNCLTTKFINTPDKGFIFQNLNSPNEFECLKLLTEKEKKRLKKSEKFDNQNLGFGVKSGTILGISAIIEDYFDKFGHPSFDTVRDASEIDEKHGENQFERSGKTDSVNYGANNELHENDLKTKTEKYLIDEKNEEDFENLEENDVHQELSNSGEKMHDDQRIRGGGLDDYHENQDTFSDLSIEALQTGHYKSNSEIKLGCGCLGKSNLNSMKSKCLKSPCKGIDCLIRAFKETQEFVDSIGKVPGMKGLGLMDPAESPYFNRNRGDLATTRMPKSPINSLLTDGQKQSYPFSDILKNLEDYKKITDGRNYEFDGISGRKSRVFSVTKGTEDREIKRQEKEFGVLKKKRSRKKGFSRENYHNGFKPASASEPQVFKKSKMKKSKSNYSKKHTQKIAKRRSGSMSLPSNNIKVSKRIMKLVEAAQTRFYFGHRSCIDIKVPVPGNMGWLWNTRNTPGKIKPQIGWKPGAISRHVWNLLEDAKAERTSEEIRNRPLTPVRSKKVKPSKRKHLFFPARNYRLKDGEFQLPPTLHIHRKNGDYFVTFYPIDRDLVNDPEKQESIKPLYFQIKRDRNVHEDNKSLGDSSSTASDMEIEFSPPAATSRYRKKIDTCDFNDEVHQEDIETAIKELYPPEEKQKPVKRKVKKLKKIKR